MITLVLANFRRSWAHHAGLQMATLTVLVATYSVILAFLICGYNLKAILTLWGDSLQMTVYLNDRLSTEKTEVLKKKLVNLDGVKEVRYISRQETAEKFRLEMSGFMPDIVEDSEFLALFPASFVIKFRDSMRYKVDTDKLGRLAKEIANFEGAEDVSYGHEWVQNYATFVSGLNRLGFGLVILLLCGTVFVIGNAVKTFIFVRREEIEILELFGATKTFIRLPYICEGAALGFMASLISIFIVTFVSEAIIDSVSMQSIFSVVKSQFKNLPHVFNILFVLGGTLFGGMSAYCFVRKMNDYWLAAQRNNF